MRGFKTVLVDLGAIVSRTINQYREWALTTVESEEHVVPTEVIFRNGTFAPFFDDMLEEIFKESYLSTIQEELPSTIVFLMRLGMDEQMAYQIKSEALNDILTVLGAYLPDLNFLETQAWQYAMAGGWMLRMQVPEEEKEPAV